MSKISKSQLANIKWSPFLISSTILPIIPIELLRSVILNKYSNPEKMTTACLLAHKKLATFCCKRSIKSTGDSSGRIETLWQDSFGIE